MMNWKVREETLLFSVKRDLTLSPPPPTLFHFHGIFFQNIYFNYKHIAKLQITIKLITYKGER